jgi:hypothetical protein
MWIRRRGSKSYVMPVDRNASMKTYRGIRYQFRPASYWSETDPLAAILRNVKGENRRQIITDLWSAGDLERLNPALLRDEATPETVTQLGRIHPSFMGGEYLPAYRPGEVEIARIHLQSTTGDVISLRARPVAEGIAYRVVDEYGGKFTLPIPTSTQPLTLAEVVRQFQKGKLKELDYDGGLALGYNNMNAEGSAFEDLRHFTRISSVIYRQLDRHFEHVFDDWVRESVAERDAAPADSEDTKP